MLTLKDAFKLQQDYSITEGTFNYSEISFWDYMSQCRLFVDRNLPEKYSTGEMRAEDKEKVLKTLATEFVEKHPLKVEGYITTEGFVDSSLLLEDVLDSMTGEGILREALEDEEVDEIQINDKNTIFVARSGILEPYVDKKGRVMQFSTNEEIHTVLSKLVDDGEGGGELISPGTPIMNTKTAKKQYRVSAVHHVANTQDKPPSNFPITSVVIRKFKEVKLTIEDLVKHGAATEKMGRLLMLLGQAELKLFCVGPTSSGKTTLLNIIANTIPNNIRILLVQNPTEISFMERDRYGRNVRNVIHWEVVKNAELDKLTSNSLRYTPNAVILGEMRDDSEFFQALRVMRTGHKLLGTYHAENSYDAIDRYATELSSATGSSVTENIRVVSKSIDIIITQFKFGDGRRRIMSISEVLGVDADGEPLINDLFRFDLSGETRINEHGLTESLGEFKHVGGLSPKTVDKFYKAGIGKDLIAEFMEPSPEA